jgi:cytochrome c553
MGRLVTPGRALTAAWVGAWLALACGQGPAGPAQWGGGYSSLGCVGCHGPTGEGGRAAPPLRDLARHWDEERLVAYFGDPDRVKAEDPRLTALSGEYPLRMPAVKTATDDTLRELARELLTR